MTAVTLPLADSLFQPPPGSPPGFIYRLARSRDLDPLHAACFADRPLKVARRHLETLLERQSAARAWLLLAERVTPAAIAGSVQLHQHRQRGEIADLIVAPAFRSQGIGAALLAIAIEVGRFLDLSLLEVGVESDNAQAVRLYHRLGFTPDRTMKVPGQGLATIMVKDLAPSPLP